MYPYQFCQDLAHILLRHLKVKPLDNEVYLLEDLFEPFTIKQVDILRKEMKAIDKEFNMTSSSLAVRSQDLPFNKDVQPFNKDVQPLVIQDPLVHQFQKTMKQYPPGTEIDIFKQGPNDWRCQNMWNGCKKLRQLCISSTQYDACTAYVHTIGINMPDVTCPLRHLRTMRSYPSGNLISSIEFGSCLHPNATGNDMIRRLGTQ